MELNSALAVSADVGVAAPTVQVPLSWLTATSRSMRFRSTSTDGSGRPARIWGMRSVAPANTRESGSLRNSSRASSTVVGAAYLMKSVTYCAASPKTHPRG